MERGNEEPHSLVVKYQTLNDVVYEAIRSRISDVVVRPGDQLVEQQLAAELGVSKSPVREAFRRLEKTGLVYLIPFKGVFVSPLSLKEFREALKLREVLEVYCLSAGLPSYTASDVREIRKMENAAEKKLKQGSAKAAGEFDMKVHRLIVSKAGNALVEKTYTDLIENTLKRYLFLAIQEVARQAEVWRQHHRRLFEAIVNGDIDGAIAAVRDHLRSMSRDPAMSERILQYETTDYHSS